MVEVVMNEFNLAVLHRKWQQVTLFAWYNVSYKYDDDDSVIFLEIQFPCTNVSKEQVISEDIRCNSSLKFIHCKFQWQSTK